MNILYALSYSIVALFMLLSLIIGFIVGRKTIKSKNDLLEMYYDDCNDLLKNIARKGIKFSSIDDFLYYLKDMISTNDIDDYNNFIIATYGTIMYILKEDQRLYDSIFADPDTAIEDSSEKAVELYRPNNYIDPHFGIPANENIWESKVIPHKSSYRNEEDTQTPIKEQPVKKHKQDQNGNMMDSINSFYD